MPDINSSVSNFHPTYETIVKDGIAALNFALSNFEKVEVMGSSLGGGVATVSLERYLNLQPEKQIRIKNLINHDSFLTTPRVMFPSYPKIIDFVGYAVGANLDAMTPMKNLIDMGIKVTVLCHLLDPVIPSGARMAEYVEQFQNQNISVCQIEKYGHANLANKMLQFLNAQNDSLSLDI